MNDQTPIDIRAYELASSGKFKDTLEIEPTLYSEYGNTKTKNYTGSPATKRILDDLCRVARGEGP